MKKLIAFIVSTMLLLTGCGDIVEIPPAHVAKKSTPSGLQEGIIPPSKLRLTKFCITCDSVILAETSDHAISEQMQVFIPKDKLNLTVDVRGVVSISNNKENVEKIFSRLTSEPTNNDRVNIITIQKVYSVYGQPVIREIVRSTLSEYTIMEIMENREDVSNELTKKVREALAPTPLTVIRFGLSDLQPPEIIVKAQETAKEREIQIIRAEADKQVRMKEAQANLEVARIQQAVDLKEAETQALVNQKLAEGITPAWISQRALKSLEKLAESDNKVIIVPTEALTNPALMIGVTNNAFQEKLSKKPLSKEQIE